MAECSPHPGVIAPGPVQQRLNTPAYPEEAEWQMVERDLKILKDYPGASYHVLHVSAQKTVELICDAKSKGLRVSCEVSPHHLYFSSEDIKESNAFPWPHTYHKTVPGYPFHYQRKQLGFVYRPRFRVF